MVTVVRMTGIILPRESPQCVPAGVRELGAAVRLLTPKALKVIEDCIDLEANEEMSPAEVACAKLRLEAAKYVLERGYGPVKNQPTDPAHDTEDPFLKVLMQHAHFRDGSSASRLIDPAEVVDVVVVEEK